MLPARLAALLLAVLVSSRQWRYFDCSGMPILSFLGGVATVLLLYGTGELLYRIATAEGPRKERLRAAVPVLLLGGALIPVVGFFTLLTHLCP